jgi:hypothetical protein
VKIPATTTFLASKTLSSCSQSPCLHWSVVHEFDVEDDGVKSREYLVGKIKSWQQNEGRYAWPVHFCDNDIVVMECEELATAIAHSHSLGLNVTSE